MWQSQKHGNTGTAGQGLNKRGQPRDNASTHMRAWFARLPGSDLVQQELRIMERLLPRMFGYHIVQIGAAAASPYYNSSPISHRMLLQVDEEGYIDGTSLQCSTEALPILAESMDVVVLPHTLEFTATPHKLLRECEKILIEEGHLIIIGFNPWSLCGLWRLFLSWRNLPPWNGHFYSHKRIHDWLSLLDLELIRTERCFYRPPLQRLSLMRRLGFLEKLGGYCWSYFGGVHIMVARKRVVALTPFKVSWRSGRSVIASGVAEPSTRIRE
jgi:SAM-dependent methyltransferase